LTYSFFSDINNSRSKLQVCGYGMNSRRVLIGSLIGCAALLIIGVLVAVAAIVLGTNLLVQNTQDLATSENGKLQEEYIPVVLRISGDQGTRYWCGYTGFDDKGEGAGKSAEGVLGAKPVEYSSKAKYTGYPDPFFNFSAVCDNRDPAGKGVVKAEVVVNDEVVDSAETDPALSPPRLTVRWDPNQPK
jgi:hypothetical protein